MRSGVGGGSRSASKTTLARYGWRQYTSSTQVVRAATLQFTRPKWAGPPWSASPTETATSAPSNQTLVIHQSFAGPSMRSCLVVVLGSLSDTNSEFTMDNPAL